MWIKLITAKNSYYLSWLFNKKKEDLVDLLWIILEESIKVSEHKGETRH